MLTEKQQELNMVASGEFASAIDQINVRIQELCRSQLGPDQLFPLDTLNFVDGFRSQVRLVEYYIAKLLAAQNKLVGLNTLDQTVRTYQMLRLVTTNA